MAEHTYLTAEEIAVKRVHAMFCADADDRAEAFDRILSDLEAMRAERDEERRYSGSLKDSFDRSVGELYWLRKALNGLPCYLNHEPSQEHLCRACQIKRALNPKPTEEK